MPHGTAPRGIEAEGRFGTALFNAINARGLSLVEYARIIDSNYEYQRKIVRGLGFPSKFMLKTMLPPLGLKIEDMEVLIAQDRMERKVGNAAFSAAVGRPKRSSEFDALMPHLTNGQIDKILVEMRAMAKQNTNHTQR